MGNVNSILDQRMKKPGNTSKMSVMAQQSATGNLTSFSGVFQVMDLNAREKEDLELLLKEYGHERKDYHEDLHQLISLTSEVKAINNQAALLHGERIKKAHHILTGYREGAFTAWLIATYGNRQTPYNFLQYFEFCEGMPKQLRSQIETMPRQAVYVLASREGNLEKKRAIVENYQGETKIEMLQRIREAFPLAKSDKRKQDVGKIIITDLKEMLADMQRFFQDLPKSHQNQIVDLIHQLNQWIKR